MGATFSFTLSLVCRRSCRYCLARKSHLPQLSLYVFPLELHRRHKGTLFPTLVYTSLLFDWLVEYVRPPAEEPKRALLLVQIRVQFSLLCTNWRLLAGSRPLLYLAQLGLASQPSASQRTEELIVPCFELVLSQPLAHRKRTQELFVHSLISNLTLLSREAFARQSSEKLLVHGLIPDFTLVYRAHFKKFPLEALNLI